MTSVPAGIPNSSPKAARTAGAGWAMTILSGLRRSSISWSVLSCSVSAPVGQTATHCPQLVQFVSFSILSKDGAIVVSKPLRTAPRAPTVWTSLHIVSQRRQYMHLSIFLVIEQVSSFLRCESSPPLKGISVMFSRVIKACSSHSPHLGQVRQSLG